MNYQDINFEPLRQKRKHPILETVVVSFIFIFSLGALVGIINTLGERKLEDVLMAVICLGIAVAFGLLLNKVWTNSAATQIFLEANNFLTDVNDDFYDYADDIVARGRLRNKQIGEKLIIANRFELDLSATRFCCFELIKKLDDPKNPGKIEDNAPEMLVMSVDLGKQLPHVYIANRRATKSGGRAVGVFEEGDLLSQPGNFRAINKDSQKYVIYAPDKLEPEVLSLFNPKTLQPVAHSGGGCDIELIGTRLCIYQYICFMEDWYSGYKNAFALAATLTPLLQKQARTLHFDPDKLRVQDINSSLYKGLFH